MQWLIPWRWRLAPMNSLTLALGASVWIATVGNWPLWRALGALPEMAALRGAVFIAGFALAIAALTLACLALFSWRHTVKPMVALFLLAAAFGAHFMGTYGVVIDPTMMVNVLQTDAKETRDLLSWRMLASVLLLAGLPLWGLWRVPLDRTPALRQLGRNLLGIVLALCVVAAVVFALFADLSATMRNHKSMRYLINPLNSFFALGVVATQAGSKPAGPAEPIGADARILSRPASSKPPLLLLVVGETARADHFSLNGYARPTNPELTGLPLVSFTDVRSCGTSTAASLPCMFSHLDRKHFDGRDRDYENLVDLLQRAGLAVLWVDNQAGCKGLCERVPHAQASDPPEGRRALLHGVCNGDECMDEALLRGLDLRLSALPPQRRAQGVVIVLHQMGSHGPAYFKRSPPDRKPFLPECTTNVLQQCEHSALVNAYDNSIAYTDHVLREAITWLQGEAAHYDAAMLYVSDHGESLGENNLYLHGLPYAVAPRAQTHVPMLLWLPSERSTQLACLQSKRNEPLSHDHLFHTVLGLVGVTASQYQPQLDLTSSCRTP